jgi:hypothetical protein
MVRPLVCVPCLYSSARAATSSRQKAEISATIDEEWVDYDTLYFMQQIDAMAQQSEE